MSSNDLYRRFCMAIASFDGDQASSLSKQIETAIEDGESPVWTPEEKSVFEFYCDQDSAEVTAEIRGRVLHNEITRGMRNLGEDNG